MFEKEFRIIGTHNESGEILGKINDIKLNWRNWNEN